MFQDILEEQQSPQGVVHKQHVCIFKMGFGSKFFENHAIVAMESDNVTFYPCKIIKVTTRVSKKLENVQT